MKWLIKNPAPAGARMKMWGDYHFGRHLSKQLEELGQEVQSDYHGKWKGERRADVTLVLRGKHPCREGLSGLKVLWIISHPETVSREECAGYDLVFAASARHAGQLALQLGVPVAPLLQCADTGHFKATKKPADRPRADFVFVGNTRSAKRDCVLWAVEEGVDLKVWGRGWEGWIDERFVVAEHIDNQEVPGLYSGAKAVFNDHWPDMRRFGYVNNRIFEALACGVPVISDHQDELEELFGGAVLSYKNRGQFRECIERLLLAYPKVMERVGEVVPLIREQHSFSSRAQSLIEAVRRHGS